MNQVQITDAHSALGNTKCASTLTRIRQLIKSIDESTNKI